MVCKGLHGREGARAGTAPATREDAEEDEGEEEADGGGDGDDDDEEAAGQHGAGDASWAVGGNKEGVVGIITCGDGHRCADRGQAP